jgi:hypothetical protein
VNPFSFVPTLTTFFGGIALALAIGGATGLYYGASFEQGKAAKALQKAQAKADSIESKWQTNLEAQNELDQEARQRMAAAYDRGIAGVMRDRAPVRMPEAAASACAGASPAQLAGPDAANLERLGRDARAVQLDLEKARAWIETVTKEQKP